MSTVKTVGYGFAWVFIDGVAFQRYRTTLGRQGSIANCYFFAGHGNYPIGLYDGQDTYSNYSDSIGLTAHEGHLYYLEYV